MKASFFRRLAVLCVLVIGSATIRAQYAVIPDSSFRQALIRTGYGSCFDPTQMMIDTTCSSVLNTDTLNLGVYDILDLTGIRYFKHLRYLDCFHNPFTFLPQLPDSLTFLTCQESLLTSLPALPKTLRYLNCGDNAITSLPALPDSLTYLSCQTNALSVLPALPSSLKFLSCNANMLSSLPALPSGLTYLDCGSNVLDSLPFLPSNLNTLYCGINHLNGLPVLPAGLTRLYCHDNYLSTIPNLPAGIERLYCYNNRLSSLPALPSTLSWLDCSYNQLSSLPVLPDTMHSLVCRVNMSLLCLPELKNITYFTYDSTGVICLPNYPRNNYSTVPALGSMPVCAAVNVNGCASYTTGISENEKDEVLSVYPNPTSDMLYVKLNSSIAVTYAVIDMEGRVLMNGEIDSKSGYIDLRALNAGIYQLLINGRGHAYKIVKN